MLANLVEKESKGLKDAAQHFSKEVSSRIDGRTDRFDRTREISRSFLAALAMVPEFKETILAKLKRQEGISETKSRKEEADQIRVILKKIDEEAKKQNANHTALIEPYEIIRRQLRDVGVRGGADSVSADLTVKTALDVETDLSTEFAKIRPQIEKLREEINEKFNVALADIDSLFNPVIAKSELAGNG